MPDADRFFTVSWLRPGRVFERRWSHRFPATRVGFQRAQRWHYYLARRGVATNMAVISEYPRG